MRVVLFLRSLTLVGLAAGSTTPVLAQASEPATREAVIEGAQAEKVETLHPDVPSAAERLVGRVSAILSGGTVTWHPFFDSAYSGGGFTVGAGYTTHVSPYNFVDVRGSYTIRNYKRAEVEFQAPRLFHRRASLSVLGGWREATQVGFYGLGPHTSKGDRANYGFQQPYGSATFTILPTRRSLMLRGGVELSRWSQEPGTGTAPSIETAYTPEALPGLGSRATYLHTQGTVGFDWRTSPGYSRRGGFYGVTLHNYSDRDEEFGFREVEYEVIQHFPILREAGVISVRGLSHQVFKKSDQEIPFFMLPAVGGGSTLRGYPSWRFRDQNSLLMQAEWRIMVNRFVDTALFYEAGKVAARRSDLDFNGLKTDFGFGVRFHGPFATPVRVELAKSPEGLALVFASSASF